MPGVRCSSFSPFLSLGGPGLARTCISKTEPSQRGFCLPFGWFFFTDNYVGLWMMFPSTTRLFNQRRQLATDLVSAILTHR